MAFFKKKKDNFVDLTEHLRKQKEKEDAMRADMAEGLVKTPDTSAQQGSGNSGGGSFFSFFGSSSSATQSSSTSEPATSNEFETSEQKRKRLAKKLSDMTGKMENLSNQIYKVEQRLELIERKLNLGRY